jgi:HK97 family phage major capsid protein
MNTTGTTGLMALRYLRAIAVGHDDPMAAVSFAEASTWSAKDAITKSIKAVVGGMTTGGGLATPVGIDFLAALRPLTALGRLPGVRRVPARTRLLQQVGPTRAHWVAQGDAKVVCLGSFTSATLDLKTVAGLTVATEELIASADIDVERALLADLLGAVALEMDIALLSPTNSGSASTPASITHAAGPITVASSSIADLDAALGVAVAQLVAAGSDLRSAAWIMSPQLAAAMALLRGSGGSPAYPALGALGGALAGLPALVSVGLDGNDSDGTSSIALIDGSAIGMTEGEPQLQASRQASIEMSDTPTGDSAAPTATSLVSMFQTDSVALRAVASVDWRLRVPGAVQLVTGISLVEATS